MSPVVPYIFILVITVVLMGMWYGAYVRKAELTGLNMKEVQKLLDTQEEISGSLADIKDRVAKIEKLLSEVE